MNQFILWHKWDIVLMASSPPIQRLVGLFEEGEILSPSLEHHLLKMPHSSLPSSEHVHEMPQPMPQSIEGWLCIRGLCDPCLVLVVRHPIEGLACDAN